jgi:hypothetical protein
MIARRAVLPKAPTQVNAGWIRFYCDTEAMGEPTYVSARSIYNLCDQKGTEPLQQMRRPVPRIRIRGEYDLHHPICHLGQ